MPLQFLTSQKNKKLLILNGYTFLLHREGVNKMIWRCAEYFTNKCSSRCYTTTQTESGDVISSTGHNHAPKIEMIIVKQKLNEMKDMACLTQDSTRNVISTTCSNISLPVAGAIPSTNALSKMIRRKRIRFEAPPPNPQTSRDLILPIEYTITNRGEKFLYHDSNDENHFLIFTTTQNLQLLKESENWFSDGTFKTVPSIFQQLYTIHGLKNDAIFPLIYILMTNKTRSTYTQVLVKLKQLQPDLNPKTILIDFELGFKGAISEIFPNVTIRGCLFHFSQCLWRKVQEEGLQTRYSVDEVFSFEIKKLVALAFVPQIYVISAFEILLQSPYYVEHEETLQPIIDYFEDTWIGRLTRRGNRRSPKFPITMWNCYAAIQDDLPKTNNSIEGWHRGFSELLQSSHSSICKFIKAVKKEQGHQENKIEKYMAGHTTQPSRKKYRELKERLKRLVDGYDNNNILDYIRGIAHNLTL